MMFAPLEGWRHVKSPIAAPLSIMLIFWKRASMLIFLNAEKILLVQHNLTRITGHHLTRLSLPTRRDDSSTLRMHYTRTRQLVDMAESELGCAHQTVS